MPGCWRRKWHWIVDIDRDCARWKERGWKEKGGRPPRERNMVVFRKAHADYVMSFASAGVLTMLRW